MLLPISPTFCALGSYRYWYVRSARWEGYGCHMNTSKLRLLVYYLNRNLPSCAKSISLRTMALGWPVIPCDKSSPLKFSKTPSEWSSPFMVITLINVSNIVVVGAWLRMKLTERTTHSTKCRVIGWRFLDLCPCTSAIKDWSPQNTSHLVYVILFLRSLVHLNINFKLLQGYWLHSQTTKRL